MDLTDRLQSEPKTKFRNSILIGVAVNFSGTFKENEIVSFSKMPSILLSPCSWLQAPNQLKGPSIPIWAGESGHQDDMETFLCDWYWGVAIPNYRLSTGFCYEYLFNCS